MPRALVPRPAAKSAEQRRRADLAGPPLEAQLRKRPGRPLHVALASLRLLSRPALAARSRPGGHGASFDWSLTAGRKFSRPWFLAGGLDPYNVKEAVRLSGAPIVDVSSGVERGAGLKDPALIEAFLRAARDA